MALIMACDIVCATRYAIPMSSPESPDQKPRDLSEGNEAKQLPEVLDRKGTLFAYGSLLDEGIVRGLLTSRKPDFKILVTEDMEEAERSRQSDPETLVILRNVTLQGVRVS